MSTQLAEPPTIKTMLLGEKMKEQFALALPKHLSADRFIRVALTALTRTPKLAECEPASFFKCLLDLSAYGIEPDGRRAHLIPFNNRNRGVVECQLIIDWKGFVELAKRSGDVSVWRPELVCENDEFSWRNGEVEHVVDWRKDRGKVQAVYSCVTMKDGNVDYDIMTITEVEAARSRSRSSDSGPWVTDWNEMAKKTVIRRHAKRLTLSPELHELIVADAERDLKEVTGRVIPAAKVPEFLPQPTPQAALQPPSPIPTGIPEAAGDLDKIPFEEPAAPAQDQATAPAHTPTPARSRRAASPATQELPPRDRIAQAMQSANVTWEQVETVLLNNAVIDVPTSREHLDDQAVGLIVSRLDEIIAMAKAV